MLNEIDLSRTDLNLLVLFDTVLAEGHVGRAAARLNLSPSAVSHGLGRLRRLLHDPLFLKTPRGVVPTERTLELAPRVAEVLAAARHVLALARPFEPATSTRRYRLGIPDGTLAVFGPPLIERLRRAAPGVKAALLHVLPEFRASPEEGPWDHVLEMLDGRGLDLAVIAHFQGAPLPARFHAQPLGADRLVAISRPDHPFARQPGLDSFCAARHVLMSLTGDLTGTADVALARLGRSRELVATVPNAMLAFLMVAESDLVAAVPGSLARALAPRFGLVSTPLPFDWPASPLYAVVTRAARADAGVAWLQDLVAEVMWHGVA